MLSDLDAQTYKDQLHPAYAGYLQDGEITEKDVLATLFHLMKTGIILPIFQDNNMMKGIVNFVRTNKYPYYEFEKTIIDLIFKNENEISIIEVNKIIMSGIIQNILLQNISSISKFPLINKKLRFILGDSGEAEFYVNGKPVTDIETAKQFKKTSGLLLVIFFIVSGFLIFSYFQSINAFHDMPSRFPYLSFSIDLEMVKKTEPIALLVGLGFITIPSLIYFSFDKSIKTISYNFSNKIIPFSKDKYMELYEFLKSKPLDNHNFNNEFLPYSIAFGLDNSWNKDFGIETEIKIDETSMTK